MTISQTHSLRNSIRPLGVTGGRSTPTRTLRSVNQQTSDSALWLEAVSGSTQSFGAIFDRYRRLVFRKAYERVRTVADSEDIVAIVFMEAWRKRENVRFVDGSLRPWLLAVTVNVTLNRERANRRYRRLIAKLPPPDDEPDISDRSIDRIAADAATFALRTAMLKLSEADRTVVELCFIEGLPTSAVAVALRLPEGTVKSKLSRARKRLRMDLASFAPVQEEALK